tara:strand:+ start:148 stop:774 length:627 start_codon:yes stop_codon:yes gene_type:complete
MNNIALIDYGMGNLHSVSKAIKKVSNNTKVNITSDKKEIEDADKVIVPGVGAIKECLRAIRNKKLDQVILDVINSKPILGICVGMQLFLESSEENDGTLGLGVLKGEVKKIPLKSSIKIPHMGWNKVKQTKDHPMWSDIPDDSYFYFVHSYCCLSSQNSVGISSHGLDFVAALAKGSIFAVQFHPEKSQDAGLQLYRNFINWDGESSC